MKIPKKIKVGGHIYNVKYPYLYKERESLAGQGDHDLLTIMIPEVDTCGNKKPQSKVEETLWHEIIHCIDYVYNSRKLGEETVLKLSEGLHQVLTDNFLIQPKD